MAAANRDDPWHASCTALLRSAAPPLVVPVLVVAEAGYLLGKYLGAAAEAELYRSLAAERYRLELPTSDDLRRMADLVETYADLGLGGADASVVAVAERLGLAEVVTVDRRHFRVVRPRHVAAFTLLPER